MKVYINPGHDPELDSGAINPITGDRECDIVANAGAMLETYLTEAGCTVKKRQSDDLYWVCQESNEWGADIFVSLHCNACENHEARGTETWYKSVSGEVLANYIQSQIVNSLDTIDRGIKHSDGLLVLRATDAVSVLVELAFIDNDEDLEMMRNNLDTIVKAIARGITDYGG